jgi:hypothetical protein
MAIRVERPWINSKGEVKYWRYFWEQRLHFNTWLQHIYFGDGFTRTLAYNYDTGVVIDYSWDIETWE